MNTSKLKRFAQEARVKLIDQIGAKLEKVLTSDSVALREKAGHLKKLQEAINKTSKEDVIDTVAYTWFNRFVALRFMDINGYEPLDLSIVSPVEGGTLPVLLQEAKQGAIPDELPVQQQRIYDVLDGKIPSADAQNEAYAALLVGACNHLSETLPFLFEKIDDYAELLLPDDLISQFSILQDVRDGMTADDCAEVEIIGWLYQFYISEKKDQVFASKGKVKKEDIPAATQLFTPRWIVEYMVQNTVGKLWLQNNPQSKLRDHMPYFIESPSVTAGDYLKINSVEEITLLDQACGSGHILVYGFELLTKIYEEEGYNKSEIPTHIIEKNLHGFEIDTRAAQLAGLALMLKARQYYRRVFKKDCAPHIYCYQDLKVTEEEIKATFAAVDEALDDALLHDLKTMQQATNLGSLIIPHTTAVELEKVRVSLANKANSTDLFHRHNLRGVLQAIVQLSALSRKYQCVVDNPPYMGESKMNPILGKWVRSNYPKSRADLMVCFMKRAQCQVFENGFVGMINLPSWMFLSSFADYRVEMLKEYNIDSLLHLGRGVFGSDFGSVAFTFRKNQNNHLNGVYRRLFKEHVKVRSVDKIKSLFLDFTYGHYSTDQGGFNKIAGSPIAYWASERIKDIFAESKTVIDVGDTFQGIITGSNDYFLRFWQEVKLATIKFNAEKPDDVIIKETNWVPYNKGGKFRKWYGNQDYIVDWSSKGDDFTRGKKSFSKYFFREYLTWTYISASTLATRYFPKGFLWDVSGSGVFPYERDNIFYLQSLISSNVGLALLKMINPTINFQVENIAVVPVIFPEDLDEKKKIVTLVNENISLSKREWDSREDSWLFSQNELIRVNGQDIEEAYDSYCKYWHNKFFQLHRNEEEINRLFIDIYKLKDEILPEVPLDDITIVREESIIKEGQLIFRESEIMAQFISYAVGCMFGRYSLDQPGLILANQGETVETYLEVLQASNATFKTLEDLTFIPDDDNVIPILDNEWFEDDIVGRFYAFLRATFGTQHFDKNLAFVEDCVGDIRKYFLKTFYTDHVKRYKKRPIYWMFSSPTGAFNALIYMHRYTPDTLNTVLNGYLKEYQEKLKAQYEQLDHVKNVGTDREKVSAEKEQARLNKVLLELQEYGRELFIIATERIAIDLDDGVFVNYNKFGNVIKAVSGLNDKKAKDKVRKFDWIEASEIQ